MLRSFAAIVFASFVLAVAACSSSSSPSSPAPAADAGYVPSPLIAARPYGFKEPATYDPKTPTPLVVVLHGYGTSGLVQQAYLGFSILSETKTFLLAYPDGTLDKTGNRFWNATDACCDLAHTGVDDVAYITAVIDDVLAQYNVDPKRIYLVGHSNGAFLSHRLACELSSRVAAIVTVAGMQWLDPSKCNPTAPVAVLQVHGDADEVISYTGGMTSIGTYPSAKQTVADWAMKNGCTGQLVTSTETMDLEATVAGNETTIGSYDGCNANVTLWTIQGGPHFPSWTAAWPEAMWGFLMANPKK